MQNDGLKKYSNRTGLIRWPKLIRGKLIRRYKRFLVDVQLKTGEIVTAHCPNTGSMQGCSEAGRPVYLSLHDNPKRKLKYTWELIEMPTSMVGVNTLVPNRLVYHAAADGLIPELSGYKTVQREVKIGSNSRIDLLLSNGPQNRCYVEIKNCTLVDDGAALFPDAVTSRGLKHLAELEALVDSGCRGVMFYLIQRLDAKVFKTADHIDPNYGKALRRAIRHGLEVFAYDVAIDLAGISLKRRLPYEL